MIDAPPVPVHSALCDTPARALDRIEAEMFKLPQVEIAPSHIFWGGVYARSITIPAGTLLSGKIHRTEHINIISKGEISVYTEGEGVKRIVAPAIFVAPPGTRRLGYAHAECVWTTVHHNPDDERDLAALEARLIEPHDAVEALNHGGQSCHGSLPQ